MGKDGDLTIDFAKSRIELEVFINLLQESVIVCDRSLCIKLMNHNACRIFHVNSQETLGKSITDLMQNTGIIAELERMWENIPDKSTINLPVVLDEIKLSIDNDRDRVLVVSAAPVLIDQEPHIFLILHDLTALKNAFLRIDTGKKQYELLAEHSPLGIISCNNEGDIEYMNQRMYEIFEIASDFPADEMNLYKNDVIKIQDLEEKIHACVTSSNECTLIRPFHTSSGKDLEFRILIKPLLLNGEITGTLLLVEDYTIRYQLEEEQKVKEERLYMMLRGIPHPAWLVSRSFLIIAQNVTAEKMFNKKIGDFCWDESVDLEKSFLYRHGKELRTESINDEIEQDGMVWDTWWIPLGEDIYLYYATNITKYKMIETELFNLSTTDALTGIYNRRFFEKKLEEEIERVYRGSHPFSLIMIDLDHFKKVNDTYGHSTGDKVLKEFTTEILRNRIRKIDMVARWGGEEFMLLLPETPIQKAVLLAEELKSTLSSLCFRDVGTITASFGVAGFQIGDTKENILDKVDKTLYQAKDEGRNCVRACVEEC